MESENWVRNYSVEDKLADGTCVQIRAAGPDDQERLLDLLQHLSPTSLYSRFFATRRDFTQELVQLANADFKNVVVLLASVQKGDRPQVIGFAAYARPERSPSHAEMAITIADAYHHHGVGTLLLEHLTRIARKAGIAVLEASALSQNRAALTTLAHHGFRAERYQDPNVVYFKKDLLPDAP
jgi:GNAT superfamily N-acetyltransferase